MLEKTQVTKVAVAGFGAAMASVFAIPEAHATIIPISFNPGSVAQSNSARVLATDGGTSGLVLDFVQYNDHRSNPGSRSTFTVAKTIRGMIGSVFAMADAGTTLRTSSFTGVPRLQMPASAAGTQYLGFKTGQGKVGWFAVNWGGAGGAVKYLRGAYANAGESIVVGTLNNGGAGVPEPSELGLMALGLLALGAAGLRRRREAMPATESN